MPHLIGMEKKKQNKIAKSSLEKKRFKEHYDCLQIFEGLQNVISFWCSFRRQMYF